jgi:hypothetical protein
MPLNCFSNFLNLLAYIRSDQKKNNSNFIWNTLICNLGMGH